MAMQFMIIETELRTIRNVDAESLDDVIAMAGLKRGAIDFGALTPYMSIIVGEYAMFVPAERQSYVAIGDHLYAGNAVVFGVDHGGATTDIEITAHAFGSACRFMRGEQQVENAIKANAVERPQISVDGNVIWQWPQPAPFPITEGQEQ
jgi:hypothetical protein